jgi:hypothetical protein
MGQFKNPKTSLLTAIQGMCNDVRLISEPPHIAFGIPDRGMLKRFSSKKEIKVLAPG